MEKLGINNMVQIFSFILARAKKCEIYLGIANKMGITPLLPQVLPQLLVLLLGDLTPHEPHLEGLEGIVDCRSRRGWCRSRGCSKGRSRGWGLGRWSRPQQHLGWFREAPFLTHETLLDVDGYRLDGDGVYRVLESRDEGFHAPPWGSC